MKNKSINVAGVDITKERFPHLYRFAENNKEGLAELLISLDKAQGGKSNLALTAVYLENDLAHG